MVRRKMVRMKIRHKKKMQTQLPRPAAATLEQLAKI
jgi:hypothetical protein